MSDVIYICAPLSPSTEGTFDKNLLSNMKDKFLINVGRGKIVNELDLYNALKSKDLKGYASDVWFKYPNSKESLSFPSTYPIHEFNNVVMTPHSAAFTKGSKDFIYDNILINISKIASGKRIDNIDLEKYL